MKQTPQGCSQDEQVAHGALINSGKLELQQSLQGFLSNASPCHAQHEQQRQDDTTQAGMRPFWEHSGDGARNILKESKPSTKRSKVPNRRFPGGLGHRWVRPHSHLGKRAPTFYTVTAKDTLIPQILWFDTSTKLQSLAKRQILLVRSPGNVLLRRADRIPMVTINFPVPLNLPNIVNSQQIVLLPLHLPRYQQACPMTVYFRGERKPPNLMKVYNHSFGNSKDKNVSFPHPKEKQYT